ncbi:hypothetical protein [Spiribacter insolitus]|uniref:Uncharacterized protein n=1 Tax=Spiribacter insolitus TaxID=3122417 RepID=A0ABV3T8Y3_9GAMM
MPKQTIVFGVLLIILGVGAYLFSGSQTALMPAYPGILLAVLGALAGAFQNARRHWMHAAAAVALLGALAPASALVVRAAQMSPLALLVNVGMLGLCAVLLVQMIRSFIAARRSA